MVDSSTAAGWAETTGTMGVLKRMEMERFEKSIAYGGLVVWCVCDVCVRCIVVRLTI